MNTFFKNQIFEWFLVYSPGLIFFIFFGFPMFMWVLIGATLGIYLGFTGHLNFYDEVLFVLALVLSVLLFCFGIKHHKKLWGKCLNAIGIYLWCYTGIACLGAQF